MNRTQSVLIAVLAFAGVAATPPTSNYATVPRKDAHETPSVLKDGVEPSAKSIRDTEVRPEEAFKYGVQEFSLIASDTGYFPSRIIVRRNIPVSLFLTSSSSTNLCFVQDDFGIRRSVSAKVVEEVRFLPTKVGQYRFYCPVKEIKGTLIVRD
jgi:heme/copper-type cytochrome/quinol oxidase subunit 2